VFGFRCQGQTTIRATTGGTRGCRKRIQRNCGGQCTSLKPDPCNLNPVPCFYAALTWRIASSRKNSLSVRGSRPRRHFKTTALPPRNPYWL
jgi:hypothetical protein